MTHQGVARDVAWQARHVVSAHAKKNVVNTTRLVSHGTAKLGTLFVDESNHQIFSDLHIGGRYNHATTLPDPT